MSPITCPLLVSSRSLHGPTDSNLPNKSKTFSGWNRGNIAALKRFFQGHNVSQRLNDYGSLRRPPCLQSHARCWFQVDLFMARLTQISPKNHTPSPVETGETSQLWRISRFFQGHNVSQRLNDYGILRRPPCLQSHARCWFQVDLFMARLTQISPKNHTPSPVETGETSQLWRISRFFQGHNASPVSTGPPEMSDPWWRSQRGKSDLWWKISTKKKCASFDVSHFFLILRFY